MAGIDIVVVKESTMDEVQQPSDDVVSRVLIILFKVPIPGNLVDGRWMTIDDVAAEWDVPVLSKDYC